MDDGKLSEQVQFDKVQARANNADVKALTREAAIEASIYRAVEASLTTVESELVAQQTFITGYTDPVTTRSIAIG